MFKSVVSDLGSLAAPAPARLRQALGEELLSQIEHAPRTEWLPARHMLAIDRALLSVLGDEGFFEFWRAFGARAADIPLIKPFISAALRAFTTPERLFKLIPSALEATARGMGTIHGEVAADGHGFELTHSGLPGLRDIELFVEACRASYHAPLDLMRVPGSVQVDPARSTRQKVVLVARW